MLFLLSLIEEESCDIKCYFRTFDKLVNVISQTEDHIRKIYLCIF